MKNEKLITIIFSILMCLSLFGCKQDTKQEEINEPITQETQQEIEAIDTKEEPKQEETEVIEEVPILEPKKEEITAKSYVLHVGIAEDITLTVNRIYSKVGAPLVKINPETTKIYEGDKLSVSISTKGNMEPVFHVDEATQNEDLTYTVNTSDVTITTGYNFVREPSIEYVTLTIKKYVTGTPPDEVWDTSIEKYIKGYSYSLIPIFAWSYNSSLNPKITESYIILNQDTTIYGIFAGCVLPGTRIYLGDGTYKNVEDVTMNDTLLTYNFYTGKVNQNEILLLTKHPKRTVSALYIELDNGTKLNICDLQDFFDTDRKEVFTISTDNYKNCIGKNILYINHYKPEAHKITNIEYKKVDTEVYEIVTKNDVNFIANGLLTYEPETWFNGIYTIRNDFKVDRYKLVRDIAKYGVYTYDEFKDVMSEEMFNHTNIAIKKLAVEKGYITFEYLHNLYDDYVKEYKTNPIYQLSE